MSRFQLIPPLGWCSVWNAFSTAPDYRIPCFLILPGAAKEKYKNTSIVVFPATQAIRGKWQKSCQSDSGFKKERKKIHPLELVLEKLTDLFLWKSIAGVLVFFPLTSLLLVLKSAVCIKNRHSFSCGYHLATSPILCIFLLFYLYSCKRNVHGSSRCWV